MRDYRNLRKRLRCLKRVCTLLPEARFSNDAEVNSTLQQGQRLMSHSNNIMQDYSCLSFALPPRMENVAAQVLKLKINQNMSNVQRSHLIGQQMNGYLEEVSSVLGT